MTNINMAANALKEIEVRFQLFKEEKGARIGLKNLPSIYCKINSAMPTFHLG